MKPYMFHGLVRNPPLFCLEKDRKTQKKGAFPSSFRCCNFLGRSPLACKSVSACLYVRFNILRHSVLRNHHSTASESLATIHLGKARRSASNYLLCPCLSKEPGQSLHWAGQKVCLLSFGNFDPYPATACGVAQKTRSYEHVTKSVTD